MTKLWTSEEIRRRLEAGEVRFQEWAIKALASRQTEDELAAHATKYANRRGYSKDDAFYGTLVANVLNDGGWLEDYPAACEWATRHLWWYSRQLARIANGEK